MKLGGLPARVFVGPLREETDVVLYRPTIYFWRNLQSESWSYARVLGVANTDYLPNAHRTPTEK